MGFHSLHTIPVIKQLAATQKVLETVSRTSGSPRGTVRAVVKDVDDPEERGRVRVLFDAVNFSEVPQVEGAGTYSEPREGKAEFLSHWIDVTPAFKGKQPPGLVGKRVNVSLSNGQYQYAMLQDTVYDPDLLTSDAASKYKMPDNSTMTRFPVYPTESMPPACVENVGCSVIEDGGPMDSDWLCVCLKRDGEYLWVRHVDLSHGHAGGNDGTQQTDSAGNRQNPVMMGTVGDNCFPTSAKQFSCKSSYTTKPQGNPKGEASHWYPPPGSDKVYTPGENFSLLNPDPNIALTQVREAAGFPALDFSISGLIPSLDVQVPFLQQPKALEYLQQAQQALSIAQTAGQILSNPSQALSSLGSAVAQGVITQAVGGLPPVAQTVAGALPVGAAIVGGLSNPRQAITSLGVTALQGALPASSPLATFGQAAAQGGLFGTSTLSGIPNYFGSSDQVNATIAYGSGQVNPTVAGFPGSLTTYGIPANSGIPGFSPTNPNLIGQSNRINSILYAASNQNGVGPILPGLASPVGPPAQVNQASLLASALSLISGQGSSVLTPGSVLNPSLGVTPVTAPGLQTQSNTINSIIALANGQGPTTGVTPSQVLAGTPITSLDAMGQPIATTGITSPLISAETPTATTGTGTTQLDQLALIRSIIDSANSQSGFSIQSTEASQALANALPPSQYPYASAFSPLPGATASPVVTNAVDATIAAANSRIDATISGSPAVSAYYTATNAIANPTAFAANQVVSAIPGLPTVANNVLAATANPTQFAVNQALSYANSQFGIPPGTEVALGALPNISGILPTNPLSSLTSSLASFASQGVLGGLGRILGVSPPAPSGAPSLLQTGVQLAAQTGIQAGIRGLSGLIG